MTFAHLHFYVPAVVLMSFSGKALTSECDQAHIFIYYHRNCQSIRTMLLMSMGKAVLSVLDHRLEAPFCLNLQSTAEKECHPHQWASQRHARFLIFLNDHSLKWDNGLLCFIFLLFYQALLESRKRRLELDSDTENLIPEDGDPAVSSCSIIGMNFLSIA